MSELTAVVSGGFNKYTLPRILDMNEGLRRLGYRVLAPIFQQVEGVGGSFPVLDTDDHTKSPRQLEREYLETIARASLHVTVNVLNGRLGRSAAAEFACAGIHGVPNLVTTTSRLEPQGHPPIWFDGVSSTEDAALERLPWSETHWIHTMDATDVIKQSLRHHIDRAEPIPASHPDYQTLAGVYERLLLDLPDVPLVAA